MKKIFTDRARLVLYVEHGDLARMTERARREGKLLAEWAREALLEGLADKSVLERGNISGVAQSGRAPKPARESVVEQPVATGHNGEAAGSNPAPATKCPHHKQRGELCYKCDPKFGLPKIGG